ncbi:hypothetical protein MSBR3_0394 [Methanosarcina barkeri 3]|uniref:Uncharacterized protein n=1 Tax=Methanosarcina barkeri 3 TaxID=1434107 RepID=A0A0E3SJR4_METBA|nr:UPF0228 family protein [Methanosarcina barkeri]AKB80972.1 hypothetical protein MSBR3_0394 [Methanosarcina barkeri 3]
MDKKLVIILTLFLGLVVLLGIFIKTSANKETVAHKPQVGGFLIEFEDGTTEQEVKSILKNSNMPINYSIDYNSDIMSSRYYIVVNEDKIVNVRDELRKKENWTDPIFSDFKKGDYYIITVTKQAIQDENFLEIMEDNNLQVKKSVLCLVRFGDGSKDWILGKDYILKDEAVKIKNELEMNEKVLVVSPDYIEG